VDLIVHHLPSPLPLGGWLSTFFLSKTLRVPRTIQIVVGGFGAFLRFNPDSYFILAIKLFIEDIDGLGKSFIRFGFAPEGGCRLTGLLTKFFC